MTPPISHVTRVALVLVVAAAAPVETIRAAAPPVADDGSAAAEESEEPSGLKGFFRSLFKGGDRAESTGSSDGGKEDEPESSPPDRAPKPAAQEASEAPVPGADSRVDKYVTIEEDVKFFRDGPLQIRPADRILAKGSIVRLVYERRGWSDVVLESGDFGTVATEVLRKAKASDFPVEEMVVKEVGEDATSYASRGGTLDDVPVIPLVAPELPSSEAPIDGVEEFASPLLLPPLPE